MDILWRHNSALSMPVGNTDSFYLYSEVCTVNVTARWRR